jgi:hypothetical protein
MPVQIMLKVPDSVSIELLSFSLILTPALICLYNVIG